MKNLETVFVLIASYRDPLCASTIKDLYHKADYPERVYVGVCWQYSDQDPFDCIYANQTYRQNIRIERIPYEQSCGVCWARHRSQLLYRNELYILCVDSHMLFEPGWDTGMIAMLAACPSRKAILSSYPPGYTPPANKEYPPPIVNKAMQHRLQRRTLSEAYPARVIRSNLSHMLRMQQYASPPRCAFFAGGLTFMPAQVLREVPFDPYMDWDEEELSYSVRLWTWGWDLYAFTQHFVHHFYRKDRPKGIHNFKLSTPEDTLDKRYERSKRRFFHLLGIVNSADGEALCNLGLYGLGSERSVASFEAFSGVELATQKTTIRAERCWFALLCEAHPVNFPVQDSLYPRIRQEYLRNPSRIPCGSTLQNTAAVRSALKQIVERYGIRTLMDIPCGISDWLLKAKIPLERYIGADLIPELIHARRQKHLNLPGIAFEVMDIRNAVFEKFDLVLVRDCFTHFCYEDIMTAIRQVKQSGSTYLLTSHYPRIFRNNGATSTQYNWHRLNLTFSPYNFPPPLEIIEDQPHKGKYLGLWRIAELSDAFAMPILRESHCGAAETVFDQALNSDEAAYFYSLRYIECHRNFAGVSLLIVDDHSMQISSVYRDVTARVRQLCCLQNKEVSVVISYATEPEIEIDGHDDAILALVPLAPCDGTVRVVVQHVAGNLVLKNGSLVGLADRRTKILCSCLNKNIEREWAIMFWKEKLV